MISKKQLSFLKSLQIKKYRQLHQCFLVEGAKSVLELLDSDFILENLFVTQDFYQNHTPLLQNLDYQLVSEDELMQAGSFESNNACIAVASTKANVFLQAADKETVLVADAIKDPGNFGTILRIADWYGIQKIIGSEDCVDFYNPKVIAASMGSFTRVQIFYSSLPAYFLEVKPENLFGAVLEGENLHHISFPQQLYLVMGSESQGISHEITRLLTQKITIPRFGKAESLNVANATAIICDNLRRSQI
jgi:RNA methyltransferase, TrmH family